VPWQGHGLSLKFLATATLSSVLLIIAFIDWHWLIIPNALVLTGLLIAVVEKIILSADAGVASFVGLSIGAAMLWLPGWASKAVSGRDGMGAGDIKLAAVLGFYFGWQGVLLVVLLACFVGAIYGLVGMAIGRFDRSHKIPLGFFISLIAIGYLL
jgi:prepilin signal peptidase PulO-like enzyme (type II secretory pathway)